MENVYDEIVRQTGMVVDSAVEWLTSFASTITSNPILMLFVVGIPVAGIGVGFLNRLIRVG